jgi:rubrerythrin
MRQARRRHASSALLALLLAGLALGGCGGGGDGGSGGSSVASEKASDAEVLNVAIGQEMTLVEGLEAGLPLLRRPQARALFRQLIAQEREHADGFTKAMRGLGGEVEAEAEELDLSGLEDEEAALLLAYQLTASQLTHFLDDVTHLQMRAPQSFAASIAASQAQHLVVLRRLLGADLGASIPEAFDTGEVPPPGGAK